MCMFKVAHHPWEITAKPVQRDALEPNEIVEASIECLSPSALFPLNTPGGSLRSVPVMFSTHCFTACNRYDITDM